MATLTIKTVTRDGLTIATEQVAAAGGGDDFPNNGETFLIINNGSGGTINVTVPLANDPNSDEPLASTSAVTYDVAAGAEDIFGPFPINKFGSSIALTYSGVTSLTIAAFTLGN